MISGKWELAVDNYEAIDNPPDYEPGTTTTTDVCFTYDNVEYAAIKIAVDREGSDNPAYVGNLRFVKKDGDTYKTIIDTAYWTTTEDVVLDFGTNAQTVPAAFYDWFTANATRID